MLNAGDVKFLSQRQTWGTDAYGARIQVYEISFSVRDQGPFSVTVPMTGYSAAKGLAAVNEKASQVCDTIDAFK